MSAKFTWTPRGEGAPQNLVVDWGGIQRQDPRFLAAKKQTVSKGGTVVTVIEDTHFRYVLETNPINQAAKPDAWQRISSFVNHAQVGGLFQYQFDENNDLDTTLSSGVAKGATSLTLASTASLNVGDYIHIEDVDDPTKWEYREVDVVASPITIAQGVSYGFGSGSKVRDWQNFPLCVALDVTFEERRAGRGVNVWDFGLTFRTVRA